MLTLEEMELLRRLSGQSGDESLSAPQLSPVVPYQERSADYLKQATELENQAKTPYPQPHGTKEYLVQAARAAMENFGRYGAPGGYYGQEEQRRKEFTDEQSRRLDQAKQFRNLSLQEQQGGDLVQNRMDTLDETRRLRSVEERRQKLLETQAAQPKRYEVSPGATETLRDPATGHMVGDPYTAPAKQTNELDHRDEVRGSDNHTIRHYFPKGSPEHIVYSADLGETKRDPNMPSTAFVPIFNPSTNEYTGSFSPGVNKFVPAPPQAQGSSTRPTPPGVTTAVSDLENAYRNVAALGPAAEKVQNVIGPYAGAWEESKINGLGKYIPGTEPAEGYADFSQLSANLKNHMVKLITGAAVNKEEVPRIMAEIPLGNERDYTTWKAKYDRTLQNATYLLQQIKAHNAMGAAPQAPAQPPAGGGTSDAIRARLGLPPKGR